MTKNAAILLPVKGMTCASCVANIEKALRATEGIKEATVNLATEQASVQYDSDIIELNDIVRAVKDSGYHVPTRKINLTIRGMTCASCVSRVEKALRETPGMVAATVNLATERATVEYLEGTALKDIRRAILEAGYEPGDELETEGISGEVYNSETVKLRNYFIGSAVIAVIIMAMMWLPDFTGKAFILWALATPVQFWEERGFTAGRGRH